MPIDTRHGFPPSRFLTLLLAFLLSVAAIPSIQGSDDPQTIVSEGGTVYFYHAMTLGELQLLRDRFGTFDPAKGYNLLVGGHGTGLAPPDEEGWAALLGSVVIDYALPPPGATLPSSRLLELDPYFPLIGDQGVQGSCAAWASVYYAGTYLQARIHGWTDVKTNPYHVMSPAWTYNKINGGSDSGSFCDRNMRLVTEIGSASMATMPYNQYDFLSWGGEPAWREAPLYRAGGYATVRPDNIDSIKALINDGYLVTFYIDASIPWYSSFDPDPVLSYSEYTGGSPNHANVIVGYDDSVMDGGDTGAFRVANSWGEGFKDGGFYWITYRTMSKISSNSPIANSYLPKGGGTPYKPLVLATWTLDPTGSLDRATVRVGVGAPESPLASKTPSDFWNAGKNSRIPGFMCIDITELKPYIDSGNGEFFLSVGSGSSPSRITSFNVEVYSDYPSPPQVYSSREVPAWAPVTVAITQRPSVIFSWSPFSPLTLEPVQFTDSSSSYNGTILSWNWSFGDGSYSASKNPVHTFSSPGSYSVSLTVTDSNGLSSTRSNTINVKNRPPEVYMIAPAGGGFLRGTVELAANAYDLDGTVVEVSFFYTVGDKVSFIGTNRTAMREGTWTFQWNTSPLTISGVQVYAVAYDGSDYSSRGYIDQPVSLDNSPPSRPVPLLPRPESRTDSSLTLSWGESTDRGSGVSLYTVEISDHANAPGSSGQILIETDRTYCSVEVTSGMWVWRVRATDLAGNMGDWSSPSSFIADSFLVNESGSSSPRADVGSNQSVWFRVFYEYDRSPFTPGNGTVFVNGSPASWNHELNRWELPVSSSISCVAKLHVSAVHDIYNPVTEVTHTAPPASVIFDRVVIDRIDPSGTRAQVNRQVSFSVSGHYEYDSEEWVGGFVLNDTSIKDSPGRYYYSVERITDALHNLTGFVQEAPPASIVFDEILFSVDYDTAIPGECLVRVHLTYSYDGSPVTGMSSSVRIDGKPAEELGGGDYALAVKTYLPRATVRSEVSVDNFDPIVHEENVLLAGNTAVFIVAASAAAALLTFFFKRTGSRAPKVLFQQ
ncbi:MAG: PKD domain-containing protein [Candidatus Methanosuratincola sp.]